MDGWTEFSYDTLWAFFISLIERLGLQTNTVSPPLEPCQSSERVGERIIWIDLNEQTQVVPGHPNTNMYLKRPVLHVYMDTCPHIHIYISTLNTVNKEKTKDIRISLCVEIVFVV